MNDPLDIDMQFGVEVVLKSLKIVFLHDLQRVLNGKKVGEI